MEGAFDAVWKVVRIVPNGVNGAWLMVEDKSVKSFIVTNAWLDKAYV